MYRKRCPKGHGTSSMITYSGALPDVDSGINRAKILIVLLKADRRLLGFNNIIKKIIADYWPLFLDISGFIKGALHLVPLQKCTKYYTFLYF